MVKEFSVFALDYKKFHIVLGEVTSEQVEDFMWHISNNCKVYKTESWQFYTFTGEDNITHESSIYISDIAHLNKKDKEKAYKELIREDIGNYYMTIKMKNYIASIPYKVITLDNGMTARYKIINNDFRFIDYQFEILINDNFRGPIVNTLDTNNDLLNGDLDLDKYDYEAEIKKDILDFIGQE